MGTSVDSNRLVVIWMNIKENPMNSRSRRLLALSFCTFVFTTLVAVPTDAKGKDNNITAATVREVV